jgi:sigma-B regulation protein RsbU (phosphoserine phosphatase)
VHRRLLPAQDPVFPGLELSGSCRAAETIGGDYYGYLAMAGGCLGLAVADVSGHGVGAALYMAASILTPDRPARYPASRSAY